MSTALPMLGILVGLAAVTMAVGAALAFLFRICVLQRPGPESLSICAFIGTGVCALSYGWGSYLGLTGPSATVLSTSICSALVLAAWIRWTLDGRRFSVHAKGPLLALCLIVALHAVLYLLPVLMGHATAVVGNDTAAYLSIAEWLRSNSFGDAGALDPQQPVELIVLSCQLSHHRMGPMFLLALLGGAFPDLATHELYPVAMAWGACLNIAGLYVLCRWAFRLPVIYAAGAAGVAAGCLNSLAWSAASGFFCQVYGTAVLAFGLAVLGRVTSPLQWRPSNAVLLGLIFAVQLSMYAELAPVLGLAATAWAGRAFLLQELRPRLAGFIALSALTAVSAANIEVYRAAHSIPHMMTAASAGTHIPWDGLQYWSFASGTSPVSPITLTPMKWPLAWPAALLATAAFAVGVVCATYCRRATPALAAAAVMLALFVYYRWFVPNPFGRPGTGQTWNLFKLAKWSFPLIAGFQALGAYLLLRRLPFQRAILALTCAATVISSLPVIVRYSEDSRRLMHALAGSAHPFQAARELRQRFVDLGNPPVYYIADPEQRFTATTRFIGYLLFPCRFVNPLLPGTERTEPVSSGTQFIVLGDLPFDAPLERLPYISIVDGSRPIVFGVKSAAGVMERDGKTVVRLAHSPATISVYSPTSVPAELSFMVRSGEGRPGRPAPCIEVVDPDGKRSRCAAARENRSRISLSLTLPEGVSRLEFLQSNVPRDSDVPDTGHAPVEISDIHIARLEKE